MNHPKGVKETVKSMDTTLTIHAIDDDDDDLRLLEESLGDIPNFNVTFHGYNNLHSGMRALQQDPGDLLFLDYRLGAKTGIEAFREIQESGYNSPVILLTGNGDEQTAVEAMKSGIADYLSKATLAPTILHHAITNVLDKHQLRQAIQEQQQRIEAADRERLFRIHREKEVLEHTLIGSLEAMIQALTIMNPEVFSRSIRISRYVTAIAKQMKLPEIWQVEVAALLSQIGCTTFPPEILYNLAKGKELGHKEAQLYEQYPSIGADMIRKIPRMERVADIIEYQEHGLNDPAFQGTPDAIPLESRILKVAIDMDTLESTGHSKQQAMDILRIHVKKYDPAVLNHLRVITKNTVLKTKEVSMANLSPPMVLAEDIRAKSGAMVLPKGQPVTGTMLTRLHNFSLFQPIREPLTVFLPVTTLNEELELAVATG